MKSFMGLALIVFGVWALLRLFRKTTPKPLAVSAAQPADDSAHHPQRKAYLSAQYLCNDHDKYLDFEPVQDKIDNEKFRLALRQLDGFLPVPKFDEEEFIDAVEECFSGLANEKKPNAVLALYDELREKSAAFAALTENGPTPEMARALAESLHMLLPLKNKTKIALELVHSEHPLASALRDEHITELLEFMIDIAEEQYPDWAHDLPDMPEDHLFDRILALVEKKISLEELETEFDAFVQARANAPLPAGNVLRVQSSTTRGRFYDVNLDATSCTCQDWLEHRANQPQNSPARLCRHLAAAFQEKPALLSPALQPYSALLDYAVQAKRGFPVPTTHLNVIYTVNDDIPYVLSHEQGSPWANVIVGGQRYGYNENERRWSHGEEPENASYYVKQLCKFVRT